MVQSSQCHDFCAQDIAEKAAAVALCSRRRETMYTAATSQPAQLLPHTLARDSQLVHYVQQYSVWRHPLLQKLCALCMQALHLVAPPPAG